jgi:hypothetical protein
VAIARPVEPIDVPEEPAGLQIEFGYCRIIPGGMEKG